MITPPKKESYSQLLLFSHRKNKTKRDPSGVQIIPCYPTPPESHALPTAEVGQTPAAHIFQKPKKHGAT